MKSCLMRDVIYREGTRAVSINAPLIGLKQAGNTEAWQEINK